MKMKYANVCVAVLLAVLAMAGCSEADDQVPDGMARVEVHLSAPYQRATRATGDWLDPISSEERIHDYWVVFVNGSNIVEELVAGSCGTEGKEEDSFRFLLPPGTYKVYAFANLDFSALGITKGAALPDLSNEKLATTNGWTNDIPMSNNVNGQTVKVEEVENQSFQVELVRAMAKLQLDFTNPTQHQLDILGYEIYPLTKTNVSLLEPAEPADIVTDESEFYRVDLTKTPNTPITLSANGGTGSTWAYVNETNASATSTVNQYSIRLKVRRKGENTQSDGVEEFRYGFTVNSSTVVDGVSGFDYIRRNDWIRLPITFGDWSFRVETLPFPPIAGFQSRVVSADALSITFNTGGYIFLRAMFRKNDDPEGVWRSFDDSDVTFVLPGTYTGNTTTGPIQSIDSETGTGIILSGDLQIFEEGQFFSQLPSGDIVGQLTNDERYGQVTVTLKVKLEDLDYQFNYNIIKTN
ncbi:MAG: FimB/Mfa2 family fimbrial subunit [Prevotella sp.]|nr:FimB/Mfa2 family fimbrial subunit [Prevotella sp.]